MSVHRQSAKKRAFLVPWVVIASGAIAACDEKPQRFDWPGFEPHVIQAGRASVVRAGGRAAERPRAEQAPPTEKVPPTRAAVLEKLRQSLLAGAAPERSAARQAILRMGPAAVDPLLEIVSDEALPARDAEAAIGLVMRFGTATDLDARWGDFGRVPIELRPLTPDAERIFDAVVQYVRRHPQARVNLGVLAEMAPLDRVAAVAGLVPELAGEPQAAAIGVFSELTHTNFPTMARAFCGNTSPDQIERMRAEAAREQRASVEAVPAWWDEHGREGYPAWATAGAREAVRARSRTLAEYFQMLGTDDEDARQREFHIREYGAAYSTWFGPSAFRTLLDEFEAASPVDRPYVLILIAKTRHPEAADFVAGQLKSSDPNLQHAVLVGLRVATTADAADAADAVRQVLRTTGDRGVRREALQTLPVLAGANALADLAPWTNDADEDVREAAERALAPYLVAHAEKLRAIADAAGDPGVARRLRALLDDAQVRARLEGADAAERTAAQTLETTRRLLRSGDAASQRRALTTVEQHELVELVPDVIELVRSADFGARSAAVDALVQLGIPALTVDSAPRLRGYSVKLDRHVAAYCYARYGRAALPLVKQAALEWQDWAATGSQHVASPASGLLRILLDEKVAGIAQDIMHLVKTVPSAYRYIGLLALPDDPQSAVVVGEFLGHENGFCRLEAIRTAHVRGLRQHADRLAEIAQAAPDEAVLAQAEEEYQAGKLSYQDHERVRLGETSRPVEAFAATNALLDFGDPRAWEAAARCLEGTYLDYRQQPLVGPEFVTDFGIALSQLKPAQGRDMQAMLQRELHDQGRYWVILALTTAVALDPDAADADLLREVASSPKAPRRARVLAAVALSKLTERRAVPVLHELIRPTLAARRSGDASADDAFGVDLMPRWLRRLERPRALDLLTAEPPLLPLRRRLEDDHVDLAAALRRLGDDTLVQEARQALVDPRGEFNPRAYRVLSGLLGTRAYAVARAALAREHPELLSALRAAVLDTAGADAEPKDVASWITCEPQALNRELPLIVEFELAQFADALVALWENPEVRRRAALRAAVVDALCRLGDARGLGCAASDPLLLLEMARYVPDAPCVRFPAGRMKYNRVEDGLKLQNWYRTHRAELRWNPKTKAFERSNPGTGRGP